MLCRHETTVTRAPLFFLDGDRLRFTFTATAVRRKPGTKVLVSRLSGIILKFVLSIISAQSSAFNQKWIRQTRRRWSSFY